MPDPSTSQLKPTRGDQVVLPLGITLVLMPRADESSTGLNRGLSGNIGMSARRPTVRLTSLPSENWSCT
jgi:hypothetical protein